LFVIELDEEVNGIFDVKYDFSIAEPVRIESHGSFGAGPQIGWPDLFASVCAI
jgi:hypothetical protein